MLTNASITKITEKDLKGGMICKSFFKPPISSNNNSNINNHDPNKKTGFNSGPTQDRNNSRPPSRSNSRPPSRSNSRPSSRNNSILSARKSTLSSSNGISSLDGKSSTNSSSTYLARNNSKNGGGGGGATEYTNNLYNKDIYKPAKTLNGDGNHLKNTDSKNELSDLLNLHSSSSTLTMNSNNSTNMSRTNSAFSSSTTTKYSANSMENINNAIPNNNNNNNNNKTNKPNSNNEVKPNTDNSVKNFVKKDILIIHVYDENRNVKKDFSCDRNLIFKEMKYFESFLLNKINNGVLLNNSKIEIDVHCDIEVFEWLMAYLLKKNVALTKRTVISILISSNFLKMEKLENECIKFFHDNINEILKVPFDMTCINNEIMEKLMNSFTEIELDSIIDKKDKLVSQFYIIKLEQLLTTLEKKFITFSRCQYCHCFYSDNLKYKVFCPFAKAYIDFHGNIIMTHKPEKNFNSTEYIINLIENSQYTAKEIYWHIWNSFKSFKCKNCNNLFLPEQQVTCLYHPKDIVDNDKEYSMNSCCKTKNFDFHPFYLSKGCQYKSHIPINPEDEKLIKICRKATLAITKSICLDINNNFKGKDNIYTINNITEIDLRNFKTWSDINLINNNQINEKLSKQNNVIGNKNPNQTKFEPEKSKKKKIETYLIREREKRLMGDIMEGLSPPS